MSNPLFSSYPSAVPQGIVCVQGVKTYGSRDLALGPFIQLQVSVLPLMFFRSPSLVKKKKIIISIHAIGSKTVSARELN